MNRLAWTINIATALLVGAGSFWAAAAISTPKPDTQPAPTTRDVEPGAEMVRWLRMDRQQARRVRLADPGFMLETMQLRQQLHQQREKLAGLLEDDASSDEAVLEQVEKLIEVQGQLERRVTNHLLKIRKQLTPEQRKRLFGLAARGVRRHGRGRMRPGGRLEGARSGREDRGPDRPMGPRDRVRMRRDGPPRRPLREPDR